MPFTIVGRGTSVPKLMGFSVVFKVSPNMTVQGGRAGITEGDFLKEGNPSRETSFLVIDKGLDSLSNHVYQADGATLGASCGTSLLTGTLFNVAVQSSEPSGPGAVTINTVTLRDCGNHPILPAVGTVASVAIDNAGPTVAVIAPNGGESWYVSSATRSRGAPAIPPVSPAWIWRTRPTRGQLPAHDCDGPFADSGVLCLDDPGHCVGDGEGARHRARQPGERGERRQRRGLRDRVPRD